MQIAQLWKAYTNHYHALCHHSTKLGLQGGLRVKNIFFLIQQNCLQGLCVTLSFINPTSTHYLSIIVVQEAETGAPRSWLTSGKQRNDQYTVLLCHF